MEKDFVKKISAIQTELKAPKDLYNKFGDFKYRSAEGILEAVKPLLKKHGLIITISDKVENIGDRFYISATATITDGVDSISTTAFAREAPEKTKMDVSQLTGATSSYARKYALNGLLCIDDNKDADSMDNSKQSATNPVLQKALGEATNAKTMADLEAVWNNYPSLHTDEAFKAQVFISKNKLNAA